MSYNSNDRLERDARESLVASDLSAKMKNWRDQSPPPEGGGGFLFRTLLMLLVLGGAAWLFWPKPEIKTPAKQDLPSEVELQGNPPSQITEPPKQQPIAQKPIPASNRYLALAESSYLPPNLADEVRGNTPELEDLLGSARKALVEHRYSDALNVLQNVPQEYNSDASYLRGHALFGQKKYPQAAAVFGQLTGSVRYGEASQWYELLALLPHFEQNKSLVMQKLERIASDEGHTFQREAEAVYGQVRR